MRETWKVDTREEVITPEILKADPQKYGGMSRHMEASIQKGIVSVPLINNSSVIKIPVTPEAASRILEDGGIDIESEGYWLSITSSKIKRFFKGTTEEIPILTTFLTENDR